MCLNYFLPEFVGGTEIYVLRLTQHLKKQGHEIVLLIPSFSNSLASEYKYENIRVIKYAENSIEDRKMIMGKKKPDGLNDFTEIIIEERPDIIHFHELAPGRGINFFHVEKVYEQNIPIVLTFHLSYYTCIKGSLIYKEIEKCDGMIQIKKCTECVYQAKNIGGIKARLLSNTSMALFKVGINPTHLNNTMGTALGFPFVINKMKNNLSQLSKFAKKIVVLADWYKAILEKNGVPSSKIIYIKQGLPGEVQIDHYVEKVNLPLKIVYMGRVSALKGLHLLIDAVQKVSVDKISLHIYGPETEEAYAIECREKSKENKNICWGGKIPSELVIKTLSKYHVLCLPSVFEMSPLVIQEAFAAGLPVIASDVYGNAEQIKHGINGWLFRLNDCEDLANKLKDLTDDLSKVVNARHSLPCSNTFKDTALEHEVMYAAIVSNQNPKH